MQGGSLGCINAFWCEVCPGVEENANILDGRLHIERAATQKRTLEVAILLTLNLDSRGNNYVVVVERVMKDQLEVISNCEPPKWAQE